MCWDEIMFYCLDSASHILINSVLAVGCTLVFCLCMLHCKWNHSNSALPPVASKHCLKVAIFILTGTVFVLLLPHYIHSYWF